MPLLVPPVFLGFFGGDSDDEDDTDPGEDDTKDVSEYGPADFRREAEEFAAEREDYAFDFTIDSLASLDEYAESQTQVLDVLGEEIGEDNQFVGGVRQGYLLWFGSYFGEVLVRQLDAEWVVSDEDVHVVVPLPGAGADAGVEVLVFDAAAAAANGNPRFAETAADLQAELDGAGGAAGTRTGGAPSTDALPPIPLYPGMDLDAAHERAVERVEAAGFHVTRGDLLNSLSDNPVGGVAKLFTFFAGDGETDAPHVVAVHTGEWDEDATTAVVNLASRLRTGEGLDLQGFHVLSARRPPAPIRYLTGTHPRGAFALAAMVEVQNGPAFGPDSAPEYARTGQDLLATHVDVAIEEATEAALERLDEVILNDLRPTDDRHASVDGYTPREALLLVGCLAGEVMRRAFERDLGADVRWGDGEGMSSTGVVLVVDAGDAETRVNPVGKALKCFESGEADSLAFMYETSKRAVTGDLS